MRTIIGILVVLTMASPGAAQQTPTVLASGQGGPTQIVVDDSRVYWCVDDRHINSVSKTGGSVTSYLHPSGAPYFTQDTGFLYFTGMTLGAWDSVFRVSKTGGAVDTLFKHPFASALGNAIVIANNSLYFEDGAREIPGTGQAAAPGRPAVSPSRTTVIAFIPSQGGNETPLVWEAQGLRSEDFAALQNAGLNYCMGCAGFDYASTDGVFLYWTASGSIWRMPLAGGPPTKLVSGRGSLGSLVTPAQGVAASSIFWTENFNLMRRKTDGQIVTVLEDTLADFPAIDGDKVFTESEGLVEVSIEGGPVTRLANDAFGPAGVAVDASFIYWSSLSGNIYRIARTDGGGTPTPPPTPTPSPTPTPTPTPTPAPTPTPTPSPTPSPTPTPTPSPSPSPTPSTHGILAITAGYAHTCELTTEGTVFCWGGNSLGQLGDGTTTDRRTPTSVSGLTGTITAITAGFDHTCALTSSGAVLCWGYNALGQLGDGTTTTRRVTPVQVSGLSKGVVAIASGYDHTCAATSAGGLVCWGDNFYGQLGDGTTTNRSTPVALSGLSNVVSAATGDGHTCVVTTAGAGLCWGDNSNGQLGDGTVQPHLSPAPVAGLSGGAIALAAGGLHNCAVTADRAVSCWGYNGSGGLGVAGGDQSTPVRVSNVTAATAVTSGWAFTCALITDGSVTCWGENYYGQLGDGTINTRSNPTPVTGLPGTVSAVAAGQHHMCAVISHGSVTCWGQNSRGQLGDGTTVNRAKPVFVNPAVNLPLLTFAAVNTGTAFSAQTPAQSVRLTQGTGAAWTAASDSPWLLVTPSSGSASTPLTVAVAYHPKVPASGSVTGTIALLLTGSASTSSSIVVTLVVLPSGGTRAAPFGVVDTPAGDGKTLAGSVAITGWTLDDVGVRRVEIWRDLQAGEPTAPFASTPSDPRNGKVFISNATFVDGARPDVEGLYPATPANSRAGWGYLMLTNNLYGQGNGTYTLYAFAFDEENNVTTLGTKSIVVNNNAATKPFGSIDTPAIGGDAGTSPNFGWALTPKVNGAAACRIPSNGIQVSIDSGPLQPVVYGDARTDVTASFPGYANSAAAGAHFIFDWSTLTNGAHTIGWLVTDDCNRSEGIGSRFFNVTTGTRFLAAPSVIEAPAAGLRMMERESREPILVAHGYGALPEAIQPDSARARSIELKQSERIELRVARGFEAAYQMVDGQKRGLPIGSTWDAASGIFSWQPAPGFLGAYHLVFSDGRERIDVRVIVTHD